eukprot:CAMPEP_0118934480 /NCGR_PEP_ID=MMETSP1169-20130426/13851_1 /TAXON_ID=36882 /ORGANISM="Pyramimonas obovata, Strain CCMP722" /LENGTH=201 /DNA_ID=CAMNT_0006877389 /DNA_START=196 /DNA_END=801 /DNA_ORIENTATION=-
MQRYSTSLDLQRMIHEMAPKKQKWPLGYLPPQHLRLPQYWYEDADGYLPVPAEEYRSQATTSEDAHSQKPYSSRRARGSEHSAIQFIPLTSESTSSDISSFCSDGLDGMDSIHFKREGSYSVGSMSTTSSKTYSSREWSEGSIQSYEETLDFDDRVPGGPCSPRYTSPYPEAATLALGEVEREAAVSKRLCRHTSDTIRVV